MFRGGQKRSEKVGKSRKKYAKLVHRRFRECSEKVQRRSEKVREGSEKVRES